MFVFIILTFFILMIIIPIIILKNLGDNNVKVENKKNKKIKPISKTKKEDLENKIKVAREAVLEKGFTIVKEIISPIQKLDGEAYLKIAYFDTVNKKMIILSMSTITEKVMLKAYDVKPIIKCDLLINDKELTKDSYEEDLDSIKLNIETRDIYTPKYAIGLLPKKVAYRDEEVFSKKYIDFAIKVQENIIEMLK